VKTSTNNCYKLQRSKLSVLFNGNIFQSASPEGKSQKNEGAKAESKSIESHSIFAFSRKLCYGSAMKMTKMRTQIEK
jgi:hypothetical protein